MLTKIKLVLKRNIKQVAPREFIAEQSLVLYAKEKRIGTLFISNSKEALVKFESDSLHFTFSLTYGIGMLLDALRSGDLLKPITFEASSSKAICNSTV